MSTTPHPRLRAVPGPERRTPQELGRHVSWQHIAAIEDGHHGASPEVWRRLARALSLEVTRIKPPDGPVDPRQLSLVP